MQGGGGGGGGGGEEEEKEICHQCDYFIFPVILACVIFQILQFGSPAESEG